MFDNKFAFTDEKFAGDKKVGKSIFGNLEQKLVNKFVGKIPKGIETYHLTISTLVWCALIILFSFLAKYNINWLWGVSIMIVFQYITDLFDGAVGRLRNTGLIKWGYYMDHFLDYIFLCSILIGYSFILKDEYNTLFFILVAFGAYMVNSYLAFAATNQFKISYLDIGPTEVRLIFIIANALIIFNYGNAHIPLSSLLPYILVFAIAGLIWVVYDTQRYIWKKDMEQKNKQ